MLLHFVSRSFDIVNKTFSAIADPTEPCGVSTKYVRTLGVAEVTDSGYPIFIHGAPGEKATTMLQKATTMLACPLRAKPIWQFLSAEGSGAGEIALVRTETRRGAIARVIPSSAAEHVCGPLVVLDEFLPGCRRLQDDATLAVLYLTGTAEGTFSRYPHVKARHLIYVTSGNKSHAALTKEVSDWEQKRATMLQTPSKHSIVFPVRGNSLAVRKAPGTPQGASQGASQSSVAERAMTELGEAGGRRSCSELAVSSSVVFDLPAGFGGARGSPALCKAMRVAGGRYRHA
jgi:hypothetical protein